jgi:hypothetical protein
MFAAIERHAAPDGGPVRQEAEYLWALAHLCVAMAIIARNGTHVGSPRSSAGTA